jgi:hypothetical protein
MDELGSSAYIDGKWAVKPRRVKGTLREMWSLGVNIYG